MAKKRKEDDVGPSSSKCRENLIPASKRSKSEARENGRKGGRKSGQVRREKKEFREYLKSALETEFVVKDKKTGKNKRVSIKEQVINVLINKSIKDADLNSIKFVFEVMGELPAQKIDHTTNGKDIAREPLTIEIIDSRDQVEGKQE